jgi:hypothetical protein
MTGQSGIPPLAGCGHTVRGFRKRLKHKFIFIFSPG